MELGYDAVSGFTRAVFSKPLFPVAVGAFGGRPLFLHLGMTVFTQRMSDVLPGA